MSVASDNQEDSILYELLVFSEWSNEQDVIVSISAEYVVKINIK